MKRRLLLAVIASVPMVLGSVVSVAQNYASRPVKIIVPWPPGGGNDLLGRVVAAKLSDRLGQPVIVENKPGASGNIGAELTARSAPDGHTILLVQSAVAMNPALQKHIPFDIQKDLAPLGIVGTLPMVLVVHPSVPANSPAELVAYARANPEKLSYGSAGIGSPQHLAMEMFLTMTGAKIVHVPYKGAAPLTPGVVANDVQLAFNGVAPLLPQLKTGKLRALGTSELGRLSMMKDIPAIAETVPGYDVTQWYGFMVPAGVHEQIVNTLSQEIRAIVELPDVRDRLEKAGFQIRPGSPAEMSDLIRVELAKWDRVVKDAKIQPQ